jgi:hypothetical protein
MYTPPVLQCPSGRRRRAIRFALTRRDEILQGVRIESLFCVISMAALLIKTIIPAMFYVWTYDCHHFNLLTDMEDLPRVRLGSI